MNTFINIYTEFPTPGADRDRHIAVWVNSVPLMARICMRGAKEQYAARLLTHYGVKSNLAAKRFNKRKWHDYTL